MRRSLSMGGVWVGRRGQHALRCVVLYNRTMSDDRDECDYGRRGCWLTTGIA